MHRPGRVRVAALRRVTGFSGDLDAALTQVAAQGAAVHALSVQAPEVRAGRTSQVRAVGVSDSAFGEASSIGAHLRGDL